ncbi:MAG: hypothetical protein AAGG01_00115 [Planctomycetota bacterium]
MSHLRAASLILLPTLTLGAVLVAGSTGPLKAAAGERPTARLSGVMVNPVIDEGAEIMPAQAFQGSLAQTKLSLVVEAPSGGIIGFDREGSSVASFVDSAGKSLLDDGSAFGAFGFSERVLKGGRMLALEVEGAEAPTEKATSVQAEGEVHVRMAHEQATYLSEPRAFKKGVTLEAGPFQFEVERLGEAQWGEGFEIEVKSTNDLGAVVGYTLVGADGTRYVLDVQSMISWGETSQMTLQIDEEVTRGSLEVVAWRNAKIVRVPFRVRARVGIPD